MEEIEPGIGGPSGLERMVFFSDAVFAIVITLLVLPITAEVELDEAGGGLAHQVWALWPRILSFLISFLVIGQFWIAHHRMFGLIRRIDRAMLGINLVGLLTITFLPLPTAILGADTPPGDAFPAVFYAISLSAASFMLAVTWLYALRAELVDETLSPAAIRETTVRSLLTTSIFVVSIGVAFLGLWAAIACWVLVVPVVRALVLRPRPRQPAS